jgi:hypothetical protein
MLILGEKNVSPWKRRPRLAGPHCHIVLDPALERRCLGHLVKERRIESRGKPDRLRENGRDPVGRHSVQRLRPEIVLRHTEPLYRAGVIDELRCFLFESHAADEIVNTLLDWLGGIKVRRPCFLGQRSARQQHEGENDRDNAEDLV